MKNYYNFIIGITYQSYKKPELQESGLQGTRVTRNESYKEPELQGTIEIHGTRVKRNQSCNEHNPVGSPADSIMSQTSAHL